MQIVNSGAAIAWSSIVTRGRSVERRVAQRGSVSGRCGNVWGSTDYCVSSDRLVTIYPSPVVLLAMNRHNFTGRSGGVPTGSANRSAALACGHGGAGRLRVSIAPVSRYKSHRHADGHGSVSSTFGWSMRGMRTNCRTPTISFRVAPRTDRSGEAFPAMDGVLIAQDGETILHASIAFESFPRSRISPNACSDAGWLRGALRGYWGLASAVAVAAGGNCRADLSDSTKPGTRLIAASSSPCIA